MQNVEMRPNPHSKLRGGSDDSEWYADVLVPNHASVQAKLAREASDGAARAAFGLMHANRWGHGHSHIELDHGDVDWYVSLSDAGAEADGGGNKAMAIEGQEGILSGAFRIPGVKSPNVRRDEHNRFRPRGG